jgi:branched-chain amino acid transport system ATP-binding protein
VTSVALDLQDPVLRVRDLASGYGDLQVLRGISLELSSGTVALTLGRNGVGKTTLLHTISGLLPTRGGTIEFDGADVSSMAAYQRAASGISLVQEGKQVFRERTVIENIVLGTYARKMSHTQRRDLCQSVLAMMPALVDRQGERAGALSGGQQQMLAIAQAIAAGPKVLLLDEPSAGLAPAILTEVFEHVRRLRDEGMAILLVEQLAEQALKVADNVFVINAGVISANGPPADFIDPERLHDAYFGLGY